MTSLHGFRYISVICGYFLLKFFLVLVISVDYLLSMADPKCSLRFADDNGSSTDNGAEESFRGFDDAVASTSRGAGGKMDAYLATLTETEKKNLTPRKISTMCMLLSEVEEEELSMNDDDPDFEASESDLDNASDSGDDDGDRDGGG